MIENADTSMRHVAPREGLHCEKLPVISLSPSKRAKETTYQVDYGEAHCLDLYLAVSVKCEALGSNLHGFTAVPTPVTLEESVSGSQLYSKPPRAAQLGAQDLKRWRRKDEVRVVIEMGIGIFSLRSLRVVTLGGD